MSDTPIYDQLLREYLLDGRGLNLPLRMYINKPRRTIAYMEYLAAGVQSPFGTYFKRIYGRGFS